MTAFRPMVLRLVMDMRDGQHILRPLTHFLDKKMPEEIGDVTARYHLSCKQIR